MTTKFILAQVFGLIAFVISVFSIIQKSRSKYIYFNLSQNVFSGLQYLMLNKMIATYLCVITCIRLIVYRFKEKYNKYMYVFILIFFIFLNLYVTYVTFDVWYDIFPAIASTLVCYSVWQNNVVFMKICVIIIKFLWGIYAIITLAYFSVAMDIFMIIWTIIYLTKYYKNLQKN